MQTQARFSRMVLDNLIWLAGSLVLSFFVWVFATFQSDPIMQQRFREPVSIRLTPDEGLLITSPQGTRNASLILRAPRSVFDLLSTDEVEIWADLSDLGPGEHSVELQARLARKATVVDITPSLIRVILEEAAQRQTPLRAFVSAEPPPGYSRDAPQFDVNLNQVLVSGPASRVNEVVAAQAQLDLEQQRNPLQVDMRLLPVDAEGGLVEGVTLDPQIVGVTVNIRRRDDVREVAVRPNINGTPPEGYVLNALSYAPQVVLVSGLPGQLDDLPDTLSTLPIDMTNRTASFEISVPVLLPDEELLLLSGQDILVSVEISALTASRQFEDIPLEILGVRQGYAANSNPGTITVLVNGPQPELDGLTAANIRAAIDLNGLGEGNYTLTPSVSINQGQIPASSISVLPAEIDVEIVPVAAPPDGPPRDER